jgi:hypothetical protein
VFELAIERMRMASLEDTEPRAIEKAIARLTAEAKFDAWLEELEERLVEAGVECDASTDAPHKLAQHAAEALASHKVDRSRRL